MAFCAIIHHFRPELIHYESLNQLDAHANCKLAFEIGECLGILKVLTPEDLIQHAVPDKLAVIAYILQLQAYFTRQDRPIEELCLVKQVTIDTKPEITISTVNNLSQTEPKQEQLPKSKNNICGLRGYTNQTPEVTDTQSSPVSNTDHTSAEPSCYIADQLEYSARDYSDNENSDSEICSLSPSPVESNQEHLLKPADEPLENSTDEGQGFGEHSEAIKTKSSSVSSICSNCTEGGNDFTNELEELEREQWYIDQQAAVLKKELCWLSEGGSSSPFRKEMEQYFLKQWLMLINKKNNVIRRKAQLNLLRKKMNLEQRFVLLEQEIRQLLALDDGQKTEVEKVREKILLEELVINVNQRDELVRLFDIQEKALEDDEIIQCEVSNAFK